MKKGASMLFAIIFGLIMTVVLIGVGATLLSTTLSLEDDQDMAVYSLRTIATSVNQATTLDSCSSAEIKMTRSYQIKAEGNLLILYNQELEKDDDGNVIGSETKSIDSITLNMAPDGKLSCRSESRTCANIEIVDETVNAEESTEAIKKEGLIINPSFNREIDETFCICKDGDNFEVFSKKWYSFGCDNPVSQFQGQ